MSVVSSAVALAIGFLGLRMFGQGSLSLVSQNVINQWWVRRRGAILGISGLMLSLIGVGLFPIATNRVINEIGWQATYAALGVLVLGTILPLGYLFFRDNPEQYGLYPDGMAPLDAGDEDADSDDALNEEHWELKEVVRSPVFWVLTAGIGSISMLFTGLNFHMVSIFEENGLHADDAAFAALPIAITVAITNLISGFLLERISVRFLLSTALVFQVASLMLAQAITGPREATMYSIVLGITGGLQMIVNGVLWARYFGRRHLGSITGVAVTAQVAASSFGPVPMGFAYDILGSYNSVLTILAIIPLTLSILTLFTRRPQRGTTLAGA